MYNHTENILALSLIKGVGAAFMKKNRLIIFNYRDNIDLLTGIGGKISKSSFEEQLPKARDIIKICNSNNIGIITIADEWYPDRLFNIKTPPPILYYKGDITIINNQPIAIIGSRKASSLGLQITKRVSNFFSSTNSICNGLAEGVDTVAMQPNKDTISQAIGVLASGLNIEATLPKKGYELARSVLDKGGLLLSEFEPNKKPDSFSPMKACKIQAGIASGLILIESSITGGSKYTLKAFAEVNRPLGVISFKGNNQFDTNESFSANREILYNKVKGLAKIIGAKDASKLKTKTIIPIEGANDYQFFLSQLK